MGDSRFAHLDVETRIELDKYNLRSYQCEMFDAIVNKGYRKALFCWPRRCLSGDTHILMADKSYKLLKDIQVGDVVMSYDKCKFVPDVVKNVWSTGIKKTKKVRARGGLEIISSDDHKFLTQHKYYAVKTYKPLHEITTDDSLAVYGGERKSLKSIIHIIEDCILNNNGSIQTQVLELIIGRYLTYQQAWSLYWLLRTAGIFPETPDEIGNGYTLRITRPCYIRPILEAANLKHMYLERMLALKSIPPDIKQYKILNGVISKDFQIPIESDEIELFDIETENLHNFVANGYVVHNSGKDISAWNLMIEEAIVRTRSFYYCLPSYTQSKKVIWDAISSDGVRFIDYIPQKLIKKINNTDKQITLINNSIIQLIGSDKYDTSLVGTNPYGIVFSEFSRADTKALDFARPIVAANGGWIICVSTPFGRNGFYKLYEMAKTQRDWFVSVKKTSEIRHIPDSVLEKERAQMSPQLYAQEYECSFEYGIEGSFYSDNINKLRNRQQITHVPYEEGLLVHTSWDIGVRDATSVIFFQTAGDGSVIRIIDYYENNNVGLQHYKRVLDEKGYTYGNHYAPHDMEVRIWTSDARTRKSIAADLGIDFIVLKQQHFRDGIESVWTQFNKFWIDEKNCERLIHCLENYSREWNEKGQEFKANHIPNHWANHGADALRYMVQSLPLLKTSMSLEEFHEMKRRAMTGNSVLLPPQFRNTYQNHS